MKISKQVLVDNIKKDILDNSVGAVSPQDIRRNLLDLIDSVSLLTEFSDLNSLNFSTFDLRTVRAGVDTLSKRKAIGYNSVDNVAIGFAALKSQIDGIQNVAVGSFALTCNMYGVDNVAVGFHSLGSTINGYGNIGIGAYSLNNNKEGSYNIAIGHGAGYYVDRNKDYQFFVASHNINEDYICANTSGDGLKPLLIGDLSQNNLQLAIGMRSLHDNATLQVGGHIHPGTTNSFSLGSSQYRFKNLYLQSSILYNNSDFFSYNESTRKFSLSNSLSINGHVVISDTLLVDSNITSTNGYISVGSHVSATSGIFSEGLSVNGHIIPKKTLAYDFGDLRNQWRNAHIYNLYCNGVGRFNKFHAEEQSHFRNKTIYLGSTGDSIALDGGGEDSLFQYFDPSQDDTDPNFHLQYLIDEELNDAGFKVGASGIDYVRTYEFLFRSRNAEWKNLSIDDVFSRSSWFSNISISLEDGRHIKADRIINSSNIGMFTYDNDLGLFIESGVAYLSEETDHDSRAGLGNFNIIANSGESVEYSISIQSPQPQVNLFQNFYENTQNVALDVDGKQKLTGFKTGYISDSELALPNFFNEQENQRPNRYIVSSYNDSSFAKRCFTLLQDNTEGYVGISNFDYAESMLPDTILNVRSTGNAICRITAENNNETEASLELLGSENCLNYGASLQYIKHSGVFNISTFNKGASKQVITIDDESGHVAVLNKFMSCNAMLSVGDSENKDAHLALFESENIPVHAVGYGQIFTRSVAGIDAQSSLLSYMDSSGNMFNVNMTPSSADGSIVDKPLGLDSLGNTFGGIYSPLARENITSQTMRNTAIGYESLSLLNNGIDNTAIGYRSGKFITDGANNVYIGSNVGSKNTNNAIGIGSNLSLESNMLKIGHSDMTLIEGSFDTNDIYVSVDTELRINNILKINNNNIKVGNNYSIFNGDNNSYLTFVNSATSFSGTRFDSDVAFIGSITFSDSKTITDGSFLDDIQTNLNQINTTKDRITDNETAFNALRNSFNALIVEGVVEQNIRFDDLPNSLSDTPIEFYIRKKIVDGSGKLVNAPDLPQSPNLILVTLRDPFINVRQGDYVIAMKVNGEYRPISVTGAP